MRESTKERVGSIREAGYLNEKGIQVVAELLEEYKDECDEIADECAAEGYPTHGSNYELRASQLWERTYAPKEEEIFNTTEYLRTTT